MLTPVHTLTQNVQSPATVLWRGVMAIATRLRFASTLSPACNHRHRHCHPPPLAAPAAEMFLLREVKCLFSSIYAALVGRRTYFAKPKEEGKSKKDVGKARKV